MNELVQASGQSSVRHMDTKNNAEINSIIDLESHA
jgi:hypothetical protein